MLFPRVRRKHAFIDPMAQSIAASNSFSPSAERLVKPSLPMNSITRLAGERTAEFGKPGRGPSVGVWVLVTLGQGGHFHPVAGVHAYAIQRR
jgi:hypothetical protein